MAKGINSGKRLHISYDQKAKELEFQIRDRVLELLPTTENKLLTQWQGSFEIFQRAGPIDRAVTGGCELR